MYGRKPRTRTVAIWAPLVPAGSHSFCFCLCLPVSMSFVPCTANSSTQKTEAAGLSQMYLSMHLHSITSQKTNLSISQSVHPCMDKVKIKALINQHFGKQVETDLPCWQKFRQLMIRHREWYKKLRTNIEESTINQQVGRPYASDSLMMT